MRTDQIYLRHILDAIQKIKSYVSVWQITQKDTPKLRISIEKIVRNMES